MNDKNARKLLDLLNAYDQEYGTSSGRMTIEELRDDLNDSLATQDNLSSSMTDWLLNHLKGTP